MLSGEIESVRGYPVTWIFGDPNPGRIDQCIEGWTGCLSRIFPDGDFSSITKIGKKLAAGIMLEENEIQQALSMLNQYEGKMIRVSWKRIKDAVLTEMIAIEMEAKHVATD